MEITQISGEYNIEPYKKVASEAFAFNDVVTKNSSGYLTKATSATPRAEILGLIQRTVLSTDDDYASNTMCPVLLLEDNNNEFDMPVEAGTPVQAMVGKAFDLNSEDGIDLTKSVKKHFRVSRVISSTVVRGRFLTSGDQARLVTYKQTVALADFVDGGGASGSLALGCTIPAGAVFVQSMIKNLTGFIGDTTAVMVVGDTGGDTDRYSTGTPSVFTTAPAGIDLGVPSGTKFHASAVVPDVLITAGSDWGLVSAGAFEITLMWYEAD